MDTFILVEFPQFSRYDIIHKNWLVSKNLTYWPDVYSDVKKYRLHGAYIPTWKQYSVQIVCKSDNLRKLKRTLRLYENGLSTDQRARGKKTNKRPCEVNVQSNKETTPKSKHPKILSFSSMEDSDKEERPETKYSETMSSISCLLMSGNTSEIASETKQCETSCVSNSSRTGNSEVQLSTESSQQCKCSCKTLVQTMNKIMVTQEKILSEILLMRNEGRISSTPEDTLDPPNLPIPIRNMEEFILAGKLIENEKKKVVASMFVDGKSLESVVQSVLSKLIHPTFARKLNWSGINDKISLKNTWPTRLIYGILQKKRLGSHPKNIQKAIVAAIKRLYDIDFQTRKRHTLGQDRLSYLPEDDYEF